MLQPYLVIFYVQSSLKIPVATFPVHAEHKVCTSFKGQESNEIQGKLHVSRTLRNFISSHVNIKQFVSINFAEAGSWYKDIRQAKTSLELTARCIINWHGSSEIYNLCNIFIIECEIMKHSAQNFLTRYGNKLYIFLHLQTSCQQQYSLMCIDALYFQQTLKG